jgi:uncharacterized repeat protein (TIGR02543 family)
MDTKELHGYLEHCGGSEIDPTTVPYRGNIARPSPNPTKEGYVFAGWYTDAAYTIAFSTSQTMPNNNLTFYARWSEGEFSLTFDSKGGATITDIEGTYGDELTLPEPTRIGYTFLGWYEEETYETLFESDTIPSRSMTLYAKWQPVSITVTFVEYEGVSTTATVPYNQPISEPASPTRSGYTFAGWEVRETSGNTDYVFAMPVTKLDGLSLWAKWTANPYTIVFEENGGGTVVDITLPYQSTITAPPTPTRTGYNFGGWYSDNGTFAEPYVFSTMPLNGKTLYAKWTVRSFTISFNTYQGSSVSPMTQLFGSPLTAPSNPTKEGYSFMGWYRESSYTNAYVFPSTMMAESITLHAKWSINAYSLTYMVDGVSYQTSNVEYNSPLTPIIEPTKVGYTFSGWSTIPDTMPAEAVVVTGSFTANENTPYAVEHYIEKLDGTGYSLNQSIPKQGTTDTLVSESTLSINGFTFDENNVNNQLSGTIAGNGSLVLKLYYSRNSYTLTYQVDGEEDIVYSRKFGATIASLTPPTRTGYTFSGWVGEPTQMPASDVIVSGSFTINSYALSVTSENEDKGTVVVDPYQSSVDYQTSITVTATPQAGYQFSGWDDGTGTVSTSLVYTFTMPDGDVTLTAIFAPETDVTYTIYHYLEKLDGSGYTAQTPAEIKSGTTDTTVTASSKSITGFTFDSTHASNVLSGTIAGDGSLVLSVYYSRNSYTLTYKVDGESYDTQTWKYGVTVTPLAEPTQTGYTFSGWSGVPSTMPASNVTVTGTFLINSYTLTYMVDGVSYQTSNVEYNSPLTPIIEPTKVGYTFSGWSTIPDTMPAEAVVVTGSFTANENTPYAVEHYIEKLDGTGYSLNQSIPKQGTTDTLVSESTLSINGFTFDENNVNNQLSGTIAGNGSLVLKLYYSRNSYTLTYQVDGEEDIVYSRKFGATIASLTPPTRTGYTFSGWVGEPTQMPASDVIVSGSFTINSYALSVTSENEDKGTVVVDPYQSSVDYQTSITVTATPQAGYQFSGWDDGTGTVSTSLVYTFTMPDGDVTLTAIFAPETDVTYTIYHYLEKLDGSGYTAQTPAEIKSGTTDTTVTASSKSITGFTFDSTHASNVLSGTIAGDGSLVLSVYYSRNSYTLTYKVDGESYDTQTWKYGVTVTPLAEPTQTGYTFSGWSGVPSTMPASNVTVTGTFLINSYTLTYMVDGVSYQTSNVEYNSPLTPIIEPTKVGYTFSGWSTIPDTMPAEAVTITGTFVAIDYSITYQLDGGQFASSQPATYNIETTSFVIQNPTKTGYLFTGWTFEGQSESVKPLTISIGSTGNRTFTAHWTTMVYTVTYYDNAESLSLLPAAYTIEGGFTLPAAPEKIGYTFDGWYLSSDYSETAVTSVETGTNGELIFYAKYNVNQYSITYYDGAVILDDPSLYYFLFEYGDSFTLHSYSKIGYTFEGWYANPEFTGSAITSVESGVVNDLALYAKFTLNSYDVEFYTENGNLIDVIYGVNYGTVISLSDAFAGKPQQVDDLIELNTYIIYLNQGAIDSNTFSAYLQANAADLMAVSSSMTNAVATVAANPSLETIGNLFVVSSTELARLGKALDVKISLLQEAKDLIEAAVADEAGTTNAGMNLVIYSNAIQGAFGAYSTELATSLQAFLVEPTNFNKLQDYFSFVNYELSSASLLRQAYQNNYPPKDGYHFVGWVLGSETDYQGTFVPGISVNAPAATVGRAKLIASYNQINSIMPSFTQGNSLLQWDALSSSVTNPLYDAEFETLAVEYEIYMKMMIGEEQSIVLLSTTTSTSTILVSPGTYEVLVIPVVKISRDGHLVRAITANVQSSSGQSVTVKKAETTACIEQSGNTIIGF